MITVYNHYKESPTGTIISIMRGRSCLANRFEITEERSRELSLQQYKTWLWTQIRMRTKAYDELKRIYQESLIHLVCLKCCCKPLPCHGDVIVASIAWLAAQGWEYIYKDGGILNAKE